MSRPIDAHYHDLKREATALAGSLTDLSQRASVYRHLYLASGGNHAFPLIAAHGALWAGRYFRFGMRLGRVLSFQYFASPARRRDQLAHLEAFANAFRDINRRVCVDTYLNFHLTDRFGDDPEIERYVPAELLVHLKRLHEARRAGLVLPDEAKREIFRAHFLHEQRHVVGPSLLEAVAAFEWPLMKAIALRPPVRFAYFPGGTRLWFRNFTDREERIERGLSAFAIAARVGWQNVDAALQRYRLLPADYFRHPRRHFAELRHAVLAAAGL